MFHYSNVSELLSQKDKETCKLLTSAVDVYTVWFSVTFMLKLKNCVHRKHNKQKQLRFNCFQHKVICNIIENTIQRVLF